MAEPTLEIVCALCPCHFSSAQLKEDEILCEICGHSLYDDHAGSGVIEQEAAAQ